ncbi:MAG: DUF1826 domain-containing protein [Planctomycetota bacterium]
MTVTTASATRISRDPTVLRSIKQEECSLTIWERTPLARMEQLLEGAPKDIRLDTSLAGIGSSFSNALVTHGFAKPFAHPLLVEDVSGLAELYCSILGIDELEVRLEVVTTNSCRKFHADYVTARLITTYVGAGSNWLDADDADRVKEGLEPRKIHSLTTGDVGIFKGKLALGRPAIHRSPPIAGTGQKRLLLALNPIEQE